MQERLADEERELRDLQRLIERLDEEDDSDGAGDLVVAVGGTLHPGVRVERVRPLEPEDLERPVRRTAGATEPCLLQKLRDDLAQQVAAFLAPRQEAAEERRQGLDQMFKDRAVRPQARGVENRRFQIALRFESVE